MSSLPLLHQIQKAVDFSSIGAGHMHDGNFLSAIKNFSVAFQLLKPIISESSKATATATSAATATSGTGGTTTAAFPRRRYNSRSGGSNNRCNNNESSSSTGSSNQFSVLSEDDDWNVMLVNNPVGSSDANTSRTMIYGNGIMMPSSKFLFAAASNSTTCLDEWHRTNVLMTSIALFNVAIAHHRYATEICSQDKEDRTKMNHHLEVAAKLYESSYKLPRAAASSFSSSGSGPTIANRRRRQQQELLQNSKCPSYLALSLAILHNLGKVYESSHDQLRAQMYNDQLRSTVLCMIDRQDDIVQSSKDRSLIKRFLDVMSHLIFDDAAGCSHSSTAPAA